MRTFLILLLFSVSARGDFRPVSDVERDAVRIAAAYLDRGPAAVAEQLASTSPLRRTANVNDEIEVRLGPPAGATWELQAVVPALKDRAAVFAVSYPSGAGETVMFDIADHKINDITISAQPRPRKKFFAASTLPSTETKSDNRALPLLLGILAAAAGIVSGFVTRANRSLARVLIIAGIALFAGAAFFARAALWIKPEAAKPVELKRDTYPQLASLLPLRRILAGAPGNVDAAYQAVRTNDVATIWKTEADLQQAKIADVKRVLARYPAMSEIPAVEILRARVAVFEDNEAAAALAYEKALSLGPGADGLWYETASALYALGYDDRAKQYFDRLAKIGTRNADAYYTLAALDVMKDRDEDAEAQLVKAMQLRPAERAALVSAGVLWSVLRNPKSTVRFSLGDAEDPVIASTVAGTRAIELPANAAAQTSGEFLHIQLGEQELLVPGGACLAPAGTPAVAATAWERAQNERTLRDIAQLLQIGSNAASYTQPALRNRIVSAAGVLAERNRWSDLVQLTDGLSPTSQHVPSDLFFLRAQALQRVGRMSDSRTLLTQLAGSQVLQRKRDARALQELAEMFVSMNEYDAAIRMYDRSLAIRANPFVDDRVRQIQMNKRLSTKYTTFTTKHFEVHVPDDVTASSAQEFGRILEAEFQRLQKWIPITDFHPVVVNILWYDEFRATYTGNDFILGFYNGSVNVPLAGLPILVPEAVTLVTHELAHAMIAQATNDQAPHWFQEGLAQRVEMRPFHENAFNMYEDDKLLALPLIDPVIVGSSDPGMIGEGYIVSQTIIRFLEAKYGAPSVPRMIQAFRGGATTEEAIARVTGKSPAAFQAELRAWGRSGARVFDNPPPVHYEDAEQ